MYRKTSETFKSLSDVYRNSSKDFFITVNGMINYSKKETESIQDVLFLLENLKNKSCLKNGQDLLRSIRPKMRH